MGYKFRLKDILDPRFGLLLLESSNFLVHTEVPSDLHDITGVEHVIVHVSVTEAVCSEGTDISRCSCQVKIPKDKQSSKQAEYQHT